MAQAAVLFIGFPALLAVGGTHKAVLVFEEMHCEECRAEVEAILRKVPGFKRLSVSGERVTLEYEDRYPLPAFGRFPVDLRLREILVEIAGTVVFSEEKATLVARGSGEALSLVNPEKPEKEDRLGELRRRLGGRNRFLVRGVLAGRRVVVLGSFEPADWEDEKK